jgi:hypothetical protein
MRVEWAKSKARAERWHEEILLLCEEMCRIIEYFGWKARWWKIQGPRRCDAGVEVQNGAVAYAAKQAAVYENLSKSFAAIWYPYLVSQSLPTALSAHYIPVMDPPSTA